MTADIIEVQAVAAVTAAACAIPGVFLVLRRQALISDAISHVVLLGIVLAFAVTHDLSSPWLFAGAALSGVATVALVEALQRTKLVKEDAAIGLVFPALFSIGVLLVSRHYGNIHLDADAVLLGELALAPFRRVKVGGWDLGPNALVVMTIILMINVVFVGLLYKELKLSTFDAGLALTLGFLPGVLHYALVTLVSLTAVAAFDAVGSVLVVALMIVPGATASLLTDRLSRTLVIATAVAIIAAIAGYWLSHALDANIAGSIAAMLGVEFVAAWLFAAERGLIAQLLRRMQQRRDFEPTMLAVHLLNHEGTSAERDESRLATLNVHLQWPIERVRRIASGAHQRGWIRQRGEFLELTDTGRSIARAVLNWTEPESEPTAS